MDISAYINSGILELYALDLLDKADALEVERLLSIYGELRQELKHIELALENYARAHAVRPSKQSRKLLLDRIANLQKELAMDPGDLPYLGPKSDHKTWQRFVDGLPFTPIGPQGRSVTVLTHNAELTQLLVRSTTDFEWETHTDELESFLILKGQALCTIGSDTILMSKGDFMSIPLNQPHQVKLVSAEVTAILQRARPE